MSPPSGTTVTNAAFDLKKDIFDPLRNKAKALRPHAERDLILANAYNALCDVLDGLNEKLDLANKKVNNPEWRKITRA